MPEYSPSYTGDQWEMRRVSLQPRTRKPDKVLMEPQSVSGPTAYWPDGSTTYLLHFTGEHTSWIVADEADTALQALEAIRGGEEIGKEPLQAFIGGVRRLEMRITALKEELLLYAREPSPTGKPRLSWRELGDELRLHHSTVVERHQRILDGDTADWRHWLTQHTDRAALYSNGGELPRAPKPSREHETEVFDAEGEGLVQARCLCGWSGPAIKNVVTASRQGHDHEQDPDA